MKLLAYALLSVGLLSQADAYKIRKWKDITEKAPLTKESFHELRRFYELIYTLGWGALHEASSEDAFDVKGKFGIELTKVSDNKGFEALAKFQDLVDEKGGDVNENDEDVALFRELVQTMEQEMLLMNAALAFAAGYMDNEDPVVADTVRSAREDFLFQSIAFEKDQMWAARSWNRVWKKQGIPERAYEILENKFETQLDAFDAIQEEIFSNGAGAPDGFNAKGKIKDLKDTFEALFNGPEEADKALDTAYEQVELKWRQFSSAFVSSNMVASTNPDFNFEASYQAAMDALRSYQT
jgi:hypothetical protein